MAKLFKGYLKSNGKEPLSSVKDPSNWLAEPPENHDYVGILYDDIIQLDFDEESSSRIALDIVNEYKLKCDILKTSRGVHLYFKNDNVKSQAVGIFNAIGLRCDIGLGCKSRVVPLRITKVVEETRVVDGEELVSRSRKTTQREWINTYPEVDTLPAFFRPLSQRDYYLKNCDTRNQTLFNYILTLQSYGFTKDEVRKTIKIVNKYILYSPLTDKEIDTITRDEAFSEELFYDESGKKFLHDRFGNYMLANCNIVSIDNQLHIYTSDNLYSNDPMEFEKVMLSKIPSLKDNMRKEVYKYIALKCDKKTTFSNPRYLGFKDNILDIQTMEYIPYSPQWVINNRIDFEYSENAYSEIMDKTLDKVCCNDKQIRMLLEEMIGYTLYRKNTMQVCFILTGEGSNGKSTILNCIKNLIGKKNYTSLDLRELEDTFKPAELYNKLANIGDDISAKFLESSSVFKKCVTGESFIVQKKYAQPFELESYATQIFCANSMPVVNDRSDGFGRRLVIVPFNATFSKTDVDYDPFIEDKLLEDESVNYLLKLAVQGLQRVLYNKQFTKSDKGETEKADYLRSNNNCIEWFEEEPDVENNSTNDVYLAYTVWCAKNGCQAVKKLNLSKEIKKHLGLESIPKSINGKTTRIYAKGK